MTAQQDLETTKSPPDLRAMIQRSELVLGQYMQTVALAEQQAQEIAERVEQLRHEAEQEHAALAQATQAARERAQAEAEALRLQHEALQQEIATAAEQLQTTRTVAEQTRQEVRTAAEQLLQEARDETARLRQAAREDVARLASETEALRLEREQLQQEISGLIVQGLDLRQQILDEVARAEQFAETLLTTARSVSQQATSLPLGDAGADDRTPVADVLEPDGQEPATALGACPFFDQTVAATEPPQCLTSTPPTSLSAKYSATYCLSDQHVQCRLFAAATHNGASTATQDGEPTAARVTLPFLRLKRRDAALDPQS